MNGVSLVPDRIVVAAAVVLTAVLFLPAASDPVNIIKLSALLLCALVLLVLAVARTSRDRVLQVPVGATALVAVALFAALVSATVVAPHWPTALYGTSGRNSGFLAYGSAVLLYVVVLRVFDRPATRVIAFGLVLAGLFTAAYGACQYAGIDAVGWNNPFNPIIAALGNPNFAAAYIAISLPVVAWAALYDGWALPWRVLALVAGLLMFAVAVLSDAVQGPLAAAGGLTVLALAVALGRRGRTRRLALGGVAVAAALGVATLVAGLAGVGPGRAFFAGISYRARTWYWDAALNMFERAPVVGVGLDSYGIRWRQERPLATVLELGGDHYSDAAHSVPLQMLGQGGLVLGLTYLVFVLLVASCLVRGLLRLEGQDRLLLGGLGGAWTAYQVQSLVSIDQVPLLVVHFVLAGAVVVASGQVALREVRLPGAVVPATEEASRRRRASLPRQREFAGGDYAVVGVVTLGALVLGWFALSPTRAAQAAYAGDVALGQSQGAMALEEYDKAIDLAGSNSIYYTKKGTLLNQAQQQEQALQAFEEASEVNPFDVSALRTAGRLADAAEDAVKARAYFQRAARLDPTNSATLLDLARHDLQHGGSERARALLNTAVQRVPEDAGLWASLGDARVATGDRDGARTAYDRALALQPGQEAAVAGLQQLG